MKYLRRVTEFAAGVCLLAAQAVVLPASAEGGPSLIEQDRRGGAPAARPAAKPAQPVPQPRVQTPAPQQPRFVSPQPQVRPAPVARAPQVQERRFEGTRPRYEPERRREVVRSYDGDGDRRRRNVARGVGAAIIIGSIIAYSSYRGPNRDNVYSRCARNFPDFDYDTGTFENEDGDRETCPYLDY